MARGSGRLHVKGFLAFALIVVIVLAATNVWNPFPNLWSWVNRSQPLSEPDVVWQQRVGGSPKSVTIAGDTVIVQQRTSVEARSLSTGVRLWERKADWVAVAGGDRDAVVAVGKLLVKGYDLVDPASGAVRRHDGDAIGVWSYRNALLDVHCDDAKDCTLTAWEPRGAKPLWTTFLEGVKVGWLADNPETLGTRRLATEQVDPGAAGPEQMPSLLGLPVDGRVQIVDTATGRMVQESEPGENDKLVVAGGRLLRIGARSADGTCYFTVVARDPVTGQEVWRRAGVNLRTADGAGCAQRQGPQGGRNVLVGVGPDGREAILDGYDGRLLWVGKEGEKLLAVDDRYTLARSADKRTLGGYELTASAARWTRPIDPKGGAALTPYAAVIVDHRPDRIVALDPRTGRELATLRSSAKVLAVGPAGMVIGDGRDIGYVRFAGAGSAPAGPDRPGAGPGSGPGRGDEPGSGGPTCAGPKDEVCPAPGGGKDG
ncbi:PQQ-binding-like beta-propeller repeat protein [Micromonospora sp. NPDC049559]|uniref:PQQ-binding-like beta-propeller repeat protein n=1 Tax=Micromonospora sp. NPDC049559 TaxID=3155923 RepID=UPI0034217CCC